MLALNPIETDVDRNAGDLRAGHGLRALVELGLIESRGTVELAIWRGDAINATRSFGFPLRRFLIISPS